MLLLRNVINIETRYENETFVASHGVFHMVQATNKMQLHKLQPQLRYGKHIWIILHW